MVTTHGSSSPTKVPRTPERSVMDQSMMVEPPSQIEPSAQTPDDATVKLDPQATLDSPTRGRVSRVEDPPNGAHRGPYQQQQQQQQQKRYRAQTPETQRRRSDRPDLTSPDSLVPFDWVDFEDRYQKALREADERERRMLEEFAQLVKYFNVWASASSTHDNERAVKRLQTRERYVILSEQSLNQKKQHLTEVVKAFQSALALLSAT